MTRWTSPTHGRLFLAEKFPCRVPTTPSAMIGGHLSRPTTAKAEQEESLRSAFGIFGDELHHQGSADVAAV